MQSHFSFLEILECNVFHVMFSVIMMSFHDLSCSRTLVLSSDIWFKSFSVFQAIFSGAISVL